MSVSVEELDKINRLYPGEDAAKALTGMNLSLPQFISGNRQVMFTAHLEQSVILKEPESPLVFTGYEKPYGKYTDSYKITDANYKVIDIISKFGMSPRFNYIYVVQNIVTKVYDIIEVHHCEKTSESHGYLRPLTEGDTFNPGDIIPKGTTVYRAASRDEFNNYRYGVNAKAAYISISEVEEDGIVFSESFAKKTSFYNVEQIDIVLNINDVLLNIYGDENQYKCFPDIGGIIKDGILCSRRKINYSNAASELTDEALRHIVANDEVFHGIGYVTDIDIWINNKEEFEDAGNRQQLLLYYNAIYEYHKHIFSTLNKIISDKTNQYSAKLRWIFEQSRNYLDNDVKWASNSNNFEFALISIKTHREVTLLEGYKGTDRYGGKGIIGSVWPDENMPRDEYGNVAEVILSPPGIIARFNIGQNYEHELNFISDEVKKRIDYLTTIKEKIDYIVDFVKDVNPKEGLALYAYLNGLNGLELDKFFNDVRKEGIYLNEQPFGGTLSVDLMDHLYKKYNIKPSRVRMVREFPDGHTMLPCEIQNKPVELVDENLTFMMLNEDQMDDDKNPIGATPYDFKPGEQYHFDDYSVAPDGEGGYRTITPKDIYKMAKVMYGNKNEISEETKAYFKDEVLVREFKSIRPVVIAKKYMLILKHVPDEKFSARSIGTTNQVGIPNKPGKNTDGSNPYSSTAIRFGDMELNNALIRVDPETVHRFMATHATNPELRSKLVEMLLMEDPFEVHDLSIKSEDIKNDVPALMTDALFFSIGINIES